MNSLVICLFVACCAAQALAYDPLQQLKYQLDRAKSTVESTNSDIKRFKNNLSFSTSSQFSNYVTQAMSNINNIVNPALHDIRASVDAAKANGKDVENCFTDAKATLRTLSQGGFSDVDRCRQDANRQFQPQLNALDSEIAKGNAYLSELNTVFLNCYSSNTMQMQSCIAIKLGTINSSIRSWQTTIDSTKNTAQRASNSAGLSVFSCTNDVVSNVRSGSTNVRITANRCVGK